MANAWPGGSARRCKEPVRIESDILSDIGFPFEHAPRELRFHGAVGCERCGGSGYRGRVGVYEMMVVSEEIRDLVLRRASTAEIAAPLRNRACYG